MTPIDVGHRSSSSHVKPSPSVLLPHPSTVIQNEGREKAEEIDTTVSPPPLPLPPIPGRAIGILETTKNLVPL